MVIAWKLRTTARRSPRTRAPKWEDCDARADARLAVADSQDHRFRRSAAPAPRGRQPPRRRPDPPHQLSRAAPARAQSRAAAGARRDQARRPRRDARLEQPPPSRGLVRDRRNRRDLPHRQSAPVSRPDRLDHEPRRGSAGVRRSHLRAADGGAGGAAADDRALCRPHRRGAHAGDQAQERRRLRGLDRRGRRRLPLGRIRRAHGRRPLLHLRHHRQSQGRALFAPLEPAALADQRRPRLPAGRREFDRHAGRADVPRQFLGPRLHRADARREAGDAGRAGSTAPRSTSCWRPNRSTSPPPCRRCG